MIQIRLKKRFTNTTDAWKYLLSLVNPGDEDEFESFGKEKGEYKGPSLDDDLHYFGLRAIEK
uniref:Uncharacterized protein n=1 Tax=viral metagenome TaxID=1070528 RepID=A0A6M3LXT9_9ZZZZ